MKKDKFDVKYFNSLDEKEKELYTLNYIIKQIKKGEIVDGLQHTISTYGRSC